MRNSARVIFIYRPLISYAYWKMRISSDSRLICNVNERRQNMRMKHVNNIFPRMCSRNITIFIYLVTNINVICGKKEEIDFDALSLINFTCPLNFIRRNFNVSITFVLLKFFLYRYSRIYDKFS